MEVFPVIVVQVGGHRAPPCLELLLQHRRERPLLHQRELDLQTPLAWPPLSARTAAGVAGRLVEKLEGQAVALCILPDAVPVPKLEYPAAAKGRPGFRGVEGRLPDGVIVELAPEELVEAPGNEQGEQDQTGSVFQFHGWGVAFIFLYRSEGAKQTEINSVCHHYRFSVCFAPTLGHSS